MRPVLASLILAGCASVPTYPTDPKGNVVLRTELDSGVKAALYVHTVDAKCNPEFQGRTLLESSPTVIAIPTDRPSYLVVTFDTSSFLRGSSSTRVGTFIQARPGQTYRLTAAYKDKLYDLSPRRDLSACRPK